MADQRRIFRIGAPLVEQGLKPACGPGEEERFQSIGHTIFYHSGTQHSAVSIQPVGIAKVRYPLATVDGRMLIAEC